ncbi:hypothetical protein [Hoeflea sp.]|uniref:hypothetical protein n=1 Tax=Hoeflea sp. TaxID=1940281 RepID=UPI0025C2F781|nr:hypothetical protein [Hoeflea sp.]
MKHVIAALAVALLYAAQPALADDQGEFCIGFSEGYKSIKGDMVIVPICPIAPITLIGSTPFREGIKAGMAAAYGG